MLFTRVVALTTLAASIDHAGAFWRLECDGSTGLARLDPLMSPGGIGDHVHSIKGGSAFSPTSSGSDLLKSSCTSCGVAQDLSAYWTPAMYFIYENGTAVIVPEKPPHKSYYLLYTGFTSNGHPQIVEPFPPNFQMIAGNALSRNSTLPISDPNPLGPWPLESQFQRASRAIGFNCLHYATGNDERTLSRNYLPPKSFIDSTCTDGIRLELQFPSCWNGALDGGPEHNTHVAYPDGVITGDCPPGYDRRLVSLFYETIVATDAFVGIPGSFVLANGDPTGYGYHGDFIAAWQEGVLEAAIADCNQQDSSGEMDECSALKMTQNSGQCRLQNPLPDAIKGEDTKGPMQGLVNGHPIYSGPAPAQHPVPQQQSDAAASAAATVSKPQIDEKVAASVADTPSTSPLLQVSRAVSLDSTASTATSTQYNANGEAMKVVVEEMVVVTEHVTVVEVEQGKEKRRDGHVHKHVRRHGDAATGAGHRFLGV